MVRLTSERILLVGDPQRQMQSALTQAMPGAAVTPVGTYFDAIAELSNGSGRYTAVLAAADPIERRPEAAVRTLREAAGEARVVLFGHPTLEPLSRKMLEFGVDDYVVTPVNPAELHQIFGAPLMRIARSASSEGVAEEPETIAEPVTGSNPLQGIPLAEILLEALSERPHEATSAALDGLNERLGPKMQLMFLPGEIAPPPAPEGTVLMSHLVRSGGEEAGQIHLLAPRAEDENAARHFLSRLADLIGKVQALQERHTKLQKLAITDELTGLYNARYFRHFLTRILERAREKLFPVTLFIFDIDNFKKYNDSYGHGVGDEILKQTAALIRRCCREHDLVARLGGDEFAVVFWEKEGPRQPKDPQQLAAHRPPQAPQLVLERFRKLLESSEFTGLGAKGKGNLTISGGVAVFPYHANTIDQLIELADNRLMFGAKQAGKNTIFLVGGGREAPDESHPDA